MRSTADMRRGWCPGALRPMRSGDGLLLRVRPRVGAFSIPALRAVGDVASRFGSGEIDLTNRGNLQIRGVSDEAFEGALAALDAAGLLDLSIESESVRNVVVDPLSGLDPRRVGVRDLAARMEDVLQRAQRLWSLPGKFGFSFSGTSERRIGETAADIMVAPSGDRFAISLDGATDAVVLLPREEVVDAAVRLALAFAEFRLNDASFGRMRDAVRLLGAAAVFAVAGLPVPLRSTAQSDEQDLAVGLLTHNDRAFGAGVGLPFGRIEAHQLSDLCDAAAASSIETVHSGAQRILVFPIDTAEQGIRLLRAAEEARLIVDAGDVRLAMDVCPGAPACGCARAQTRRDAQRFADTFSGSLAGRSVHISGCEKGCARRAAASLTFVGQGDCYDVVRNGCASDPAEETIAAQDIGAALSRLLSGAVT